MGVDLKLLPLLGMDFWASHDILRLERRRELWPAIDNLPQKDIPKPLSCHEARTKEGECCYGDQDTSPYGEGLKWTTAKALLTLKDHESVQDNWMNRAVWKYLEQMPPDWPIVLYWH